MRLSLRKIRFSAFRAKLRAAPSTLFKVNSVAGRSPLRGLKPPAGIRRVLFPEHLTARLRCADGEKREDRPVRDGAMAIDVGEHGRFQLVRKRGPADSAP